jgi:hypothetical protein
MLILVALLAVATAFIPMSRFVHTLFTIVFVAVAVIAMGVGGCTQYWDNHMQPGRTMGREVIFHAFLILVARLVAVIFFLNATDADRD